MSHGTAHHIEGFKKNKQNALNNDNGNGNGSQAATARMVPTSTMTFSALNGIVKRSNETQIKE